MFGRKSPEAAAAKQAQADHNARFNHADTDPDSADYLASHDHVIATENATKAAR
ncbi:hypothetical protein ACIBI8_37090 [Streptomyces sp. NPDC050529]|uniref:hypothetical protein n=1 Tax=Streptomyces sp. NPDC050529 TaxID=3365624 RepID=UPI0037B7F4E7